MIHHGLSAHPLASMPINHLNRKFGMPSFHFQTHFCMPVTLSPGISVHPCTIDPLLRTPIQLQINKIIMIKWGASKRAKETLKYLQWLASLISHHAWWKLSLSKICLYPPTLRHGHYAGK